MSNVLFGKYDSGKQYKGGLRAVVVVVVPCCKEGSAAIDVAVVVVVVVVAAEPTYSNMARCTTLAFLLLGSSISRH